MDKKYNRMVTTGRKKKKRQTELKDGLMTDDIKSSRYLVKWYNLAKEGQE